MKLCKVLGIDIIATTDWFIMFFIIFLNLSTTILPKHCPKLITIEYFTLGLITTLLFYTCLVLHELGHSIAAKLNGLPVNKILLFMLGGVANLESEPKTAISELRITVAGPSVTFIIVLLTGAITFCTHGVLHEISDILFSVNIFMLVLNMLPIFPLDGGRIFHSLIWIKTGDQLLSTKCAYETTKGMAIVLPIIGFFIGGFGTAIWFGVISLFVVFGAKMTYEKLLDEKKEELKENFEFLELTKRG
jgi:Zn-dependent protease